VNLLTDTPPESIVIDGKEYKINTDFRSCLRIMLAFEDNELSSLEKQSVMISNLYPVLPSDVKKAMEHGSWFLNAGKESDADNDAPRVYSFSKDADMIFSAFRQIHKIDLATTELHWWIFTALFMAVLASQDNPFGSLVSLRLRVKTGRATKEEARAYRELGDMAEVPEIDDRTLEEREAEAEFMRLIGVNKK